MITVCTSANFCREFKSWWKHYTWEDLKSTLKNILTSFYSKMCEQIIIRFVLHAKLYLYQQTFVGRKPKFGPFQLCIYFDVRNTFVNKNVSQYRIFIVRSRGGGCPSVLHCVYMYCLIISVYCIYFFSCK